VVVYSKRGIRRKNLKDNLRDEDGADWDKERKVIRAIKRGEAKKKKKNASKLVL